MSRRSRTSTLRNFYFSRPWHCTPVPNSSLHIGSWAVDPRTGDLYDASVCAEYRNAAVHSLQQQLRKRIGLSEGDYRKLKQRPPMCDPGENVELRTGKY